MNDNSNDSIDSTDVDTKVNTVIVPVRFNVEETNATWMLGRDFVIIYICPGM